MIHFARTVLGGRRCRRDERKGAIVVLVALLIVALLAMVAFTVDIGYIVAVDTQMQRTADACALAAACVLPDRAEALSVAQATARENAGAGGPELQVTDVEPGMWDRDTATFTASGAPEVNAVRVTVRRTAARGNALQLFFAPVLGQRQAEVVTTATAMYDEDLCGPLVGIDWVSVPGDPRTDSYRSTRGSYGSQTPRDRGSLCSDGPITLEGGPVVNGDANPGKGSRTTLTGNSVLTGNRTPRLRPLKISPVDPTEAAASNDNNALPKVQKGKSWVSPVDSRRNFLIDGGADYTIQPGTYYLNNFSITGNSKLRFAGPTTIYLTGSLDTAGGDVFNNTQVPGNVQIMMTGSTARVAARVDFHGVIYAPNTAVTVDGGADWFGAVVGKTLTATGNTQFHYDEDLDLATHTPRRVALVE
jgi:Flp pilus assembly protein TadG